MSSRLVVTYFLGIDGQLTAQVKESPTYHHYLLPTVFLLPSITSSFLFLTVLFISGPKCYRDNKAAVISSEDLKCDILSHSSDTKSSKEAAQSALLTP